MNINLTDFTHNGVCSRCGECCSDMLHLSSEEVFRIDEYLKDKNIKPRPYKTGYTDLSCPFRNDMLKICMIYEVRPDICKIFKCNKPPKEAIINREFTNFNKEPRSMRAVFFNDYRNVREIPVLKGRLENEK